MIEIRVGRAVVDGRATVVASDAEHAVAVAGADMTDVVGGWADWRPRLEALLAGAEPALDLSGARWLPPVAPRKLICVGTNFSDHIAEMEAAGAPTGANPWPYAFLKPPSTTLVGDGATVALPGYAEKVDWEAELAIVVGDPTRGADDPLGAVFGFGVVNDLSVRDFIPFPHALGNDALVSKGFDGSAPMGPWLVPAEQVPDPQALPIALRVNGETKQSSSTANMIFGVREIVAHFLAILTLEPGDVLAAGTPAGVGAARRPAEFLRVGDVVEAEVTGIGRVRTTMAASPRPVEVLTAR